MTRRFSPSALTALSLLALFLVGCSGGGSSDMNGWQKSVEQYVHERGDDPAVLRDVTIEDKRPGFVVIGGLEPGKSTDARALLLAHKTIDNRPWFIYLVGIVKKQKVDDIRMAAVSMTSGQTTWRIGPRDTHAFKLYRDWGWNEWKTRTGGDRSHAPPEYTTFPRASDVFDLTVEGTRVTAKHVASGATWVDDLTGPANNSHKKR